MPRIREDIQAGAMRATFHTPLILVYLITQIFGEKYKL